MNMPKIDMSSIVSILLALALAFTSMGGVTANIEDTVSFDAKISLDVEAIMALSGQTAQEGLTEAAQKQLEEQKEIVKVIGDIISSLTLRGVASKDTAEAVILAGDSVALSIGMKKDDTGVKAASSLLPNNVIFISNELIQMMQEQMEQQAQQLAEQTAALTGEGQVPMAGSVQSAASSLDPQAIAAILEKLDKEQIAKDIEEAGKKLTEGIEAKKGETETGEFTVDDMAFVSKTPVNMTYPEFVEFLLTGAKELAAKEGEEIIQEVKELQKKWNEVGHVPFRDKDRLYKEYREVCDKIYGALSASHAKRHLNNFRNNLAQKIEKEGGSLSNERQRMMRAYERMRDELNTYENNLGFLSSNSKKGNSLVDNMKKKVEKLRDELSLLAQKIKAVDEQIANEGK